MNYKETLDTLYNMMPDFQRVGADAYKPGLDRVTEFNNVLGRPDASFDAVHVAGTNGKGSVCSMLASVLRSAGYRTGLYTSPHLTDFRERIKVDGEMIPESAVMDFADRYMEVMRALGLSFFEATMCMAFDWFARNGVEVAVVETGMGGRLDSTNILKPIASIITNIGMDHQKFLGDTPAKIAGEKAGIIKPGIPAVVGERDPETDPVFEGKAGEVGTRLFFAQDMYRCLGARKEGGLQTFSMTNLCTGTEFEVATDLMGDYQCRNIVTVMGAISVMNRHTQLTVSNRSVTEGLRTAALSTGLRGRWEVIGHDPLTVVDTGHNAHGLRLVTQQLAGEKYDRLYMVVGMVDDKDFDRVLPLFPRDAHYIFTSASIHRALPADELARKAAAYGLQGEVIAGVPAALARARELASPRDMIFVGGSTFTVADII